MENTYVLAMYDVRAKQKFIYRSEHLKEIIGGSAIIRDVFKDYLYPAAREVRNRLQGLDADSEAGQQDAIYIYDPKDAKDQFDFDRFIQHVDENHEDSSQFKGQYLGEVVYDGGGNLLVLYKSTQICRDVTAAFTRDVLKSIGTLKVICTYITDINRDDYEADRKKLYLKHRYTESQETPTAPWGSLPIVQADYLTSMPLTDYRWDENGKHVAITKEAAAKYAKYAEERKQNDEKDSKTIPTETILDNLVTNKGEESLLAVIYMDGNNMGAKIAEHNEGKTTYKDCIKSLREFSDEIQRTFIDDRLDVIDDATRKYSGKAHGSKEEAGALRLVVGAGDEITIITNARAAFQVVRDYLLNLPDGWSSCAGISVFHSHTPFADAYRIAEECCESGKQYMKQKAIEAEKAGNEALKDAWSNACMLDFHYNQGAIGVSLDDIRQAEETTTLIPWIVKGPIVASPDAEDSDHDVTLDGEISDADVQKMQRILNQFGRSNTKGLLQAARAGRGELSKEIARICAHMKSGKTVESITHDDLLFKNDMITEKARCLMMQMIPVFDIWFNQPEQSQDTNDAVKEESKEGEHE